MSGEVFGLDSLKDSSVSKCNRLHVVINLSVFLHQFEVRSTQTSNMIGNVPEVLNLNGLFLELNRFICN